MSAFEPSRHSTRSATPAQAAFKIILACTHKWQAKHFTIREVATMISEIVLFRLPNGMSRADAMTKYRARVPMWRANPDPIHKAFLFDETSRRGGGVYLWKNIEAAKKAHGPAFEEAIQSIFG
ncbi:MAG: hypothetical protein WCE72_19120, partial [Pseudolabrys sp.]